MRVALLGVGQIGGSIARALRAGTGGSVGVDRIMAWSPSGDGPREALRAGVIDAAAGSIDGAVDGADLIILAAPPLDCLDLIHGLGELRERAAPGALFTDVASTKELIVAAAASARLPFVGGHPMAGTEGIGFGASRADLFRGRPWVVVPGATSPADGVERVEAFARACGADPLRLDAATHDRAVAAISHVPLVVAAALVEAVIGSGDGPNRPEWALETRLAAGGWASMTRVALGSPEMSAGIAATNAEAIAARLRDLRSVIDAWIAMLDSEAGDAAGLAQRFRAARDRLAPAGDRLPPAERG
jgi:prephenate dehydrogenase